MSLGMSFVILYTNYSTPWKNYPFEVETGDDKRLFNVPRALILHRHDGKFGFPGGSMELGETAVETAIRELREETNVVLQEKDLTLLCQNTTHSNRIIHCFHHETTIEKLLEYQISSISMGSHSAEIAGASLPHLCYYPARNNGFTGMPTLLDNSFSGTARKELKLLYDTIIKK